MQGYLTPKISCNDGIVEQTITRHGSLLRSAATEHDDSD